MINSEDEVTNPEKLLADLCPKTGGPILCVGLICLDNITYAKIFPDEDSDQRCEDMVWTAGGNATNNTIVLKQLGNQCEMIGTLGDDHSSEFAAAYLQKLDINFRKSAKRHDQQMPVSCCIISSANGSRTVLHAPKSIVEFKEEEFRTCFPSATSLAQFNWIHFEGRNALETRKMLTYIAQLRQADEEALGHLKVSVEIEKRYDDIELLIPGADFVFLSKAFAKSRGFGDMCSAVEGVHKKWADKHAVIICGWGELGAAGFLPTTQEIIKIPAHPPTHAVDTLGAGDTFIAGVIHALNAGVAVKQAIEFGCRLAGRKCGIRGLRNII